MKIEEARELIEICQEYIDVYESYDPVTLKENAIKLYAEHQNVTIVTNTLNEMGFRKTGKLVAGKRAEVKFLSNDITKIIDSDIEPDDLLHPIVKRYLNRNRRRKGVGM